MDTPDTVWTVYTPWIDTSSVVSFLDFVLVLLQMDKSDEQTWYGHIEQFLMEFLRNCSSFFLHHTSLMMMIYDDDDDDLVVWFFEFIWICISHLGSLICTNVCTDIHSHRSGWKPFIFRNYFYSSYNNFTTIFPTILTIFFPITFAIMTSAPRFALIYVH